MLYDKREVPETMKNTKGEAQNPMVKCGIRVGITRRLLRNEPKLHSEKDWGNEEWVRGECHKQRQQH